MAPIKFNNNKLKTYIVDDKEFTPVDLNPSTVLTSSKNRILNKKKPYSELEDYLNSIFYGDKKGKVRRTADNSKLSDVVSKYLTQRFKNAIDNFSFDQAAISSSDSSNSGKILIDEYITLNHKNYEELDTVVERFKRIQNQLNLLSNSSDPEKEYKKIIEDLKQARAAAYQLLSKEATVEKLKGKEKFITFFSTEKEKKLIDELDELYAEVVFFRDLPLSSSDLGYFFEKALNAVGQNGQIIENITDEMLMEVFEEKTAGTQTVNRGSLNITKEMKPFVKKEKKEKDKIDYLIEGSNGSFFKIKEEFSKKQGKMDVLLQYPNSSIPFRVSAKNWDILNSQKSLGITSIERGLMRTANLKPTLSYGMYLADEEEADGSIIVQNAHKFAQVCLLVDILMGYSQENGYADTLIINDRKTSRIRVFSINQILNNVIKNLDNFYISNYKNKEQNIRQKLKGINIRGNNTKGAFGDILSILNSIEISLTAGDIKIV